MENLCKVVIISGFLGSGKTTLVEQILKAPSLNKKVAVIQNEFSASMGIESALMKDGDGNEIQDFYEMANGCICCAAKDDLISTLDVLLENKKQEIEYILVETNGLADSSQLIKTFWLDEGMGSKVQLFQTIAIIDTINFRKDSESELVPKDAYQQNNQALNELLLKQLVFADKILLNKTDLLKKSFQQNEYENEIKYIKECIYHVNKNAILKETEYSKVELDFIIEKTDVENSQSNYLQSQEINEHQSHKLSHSIIDSIKSVYITIENEIHIEKDKFEIFIGELLWEGHARNINIMRCKGIFLDSEQLYILQGVQDVFEIREIDFTKKVQHSRFLLVGKGDIDGEQIKQEIIQKCQKD